MDASNKMNRFFAAAFAVAFLMCGATTQAGMISVDFDAVTGATLAGTTGVDIADSPFPLGIGSASLDLSGVDGEFDGTPFAGAAVAPTDDRNLDFLFENTGNQSTVVLNGVSPNATVSVTVYSTSFRDTNFTYNATTTLVAAGASSTIINAQTGSTSYAFTFGTGTGGEGNLAGVDISIVPAPAALPAGLAMLGLAAARRRRR